MPSYIKPGVYIEETLKPTQPVPTSGAPSVAVFVGVTDRGPTTTTVGGDVVAVPTLVRSWSEFVSKFSFGTALNTFTSTVDSDSETLKYAVKSYFENGGGQAYITRIVNTDAVTASLVLPDGDVAALNVYANSAGAWGSNVYVEVVASATTGHFDLIVYYYEGASTPTSSNIVERFNQLNMDATSTRYAVTAVSSEYITLEKPTANTSNRIPDVVSAVSLGDTATLATTASTITAVSRTNTSATITSSGAGAKYPTGTKIVVSGLVSPDTALNGTWTVTGTTTNTVSFTTGTSGSLSTTGLSVAGLTGYEGVVGSAGSALPDIATEVLAKIDPIQGPLVLNWADLKFDGDVNYAGLADDILEYAYTRGDVFAVIDAPDASVASVITTIEGYNTAYTSYGAAYYPRVVVSDPLSRVGGTKTIAPGGAVTAMYINADAQKGAFQSPAGVSTRLNGVVSVASLSNTEFSAIAASAVALNVIRYMPGAGICVMGARTLSSDPDTKYVSVRRSLQYINRSLNDLTQFAIFEPNDDVLWGRVRSVIDSFLYGYWKKGGLKGVSTSQAYYVKCDGELNSSSVIDAGELRVEVGVALQRPAEFIVIKIGQMDGVTTVTAL